MVKIAIKNIKFLKMVSKIPILKHCFIVKVSPEFNKILSERILNKFYKDIYVSNKTSKKTHINRFPDINEISLSYLNNKNEVIIHDIAVSNGISSVELKELLMLKNITNSFFISDKFAEVFVKKGIITKVFSVDNDLIFAYFWFLFAVDKNVFFPLTVFLFKLIKKQKLIDGADYKLLLLHPKVLNKIKNEEIKFINYDIFNTKVYNKFTFIRVMNILNLGYFNENQIIRALENIFISLKNEGVILIGRTNSNNINNASFFKKKDSKLILLEDVNDGTEIKHLIEKL